MARRSARLSSRKSSTPQPIKRVSLSHDGHAPRTVPAKLASLIEDEAMPGSYPESPIAQAKNASVKQLANMPSTPTHAPELKAATSEMHPQIFHQTTAKPHEDARWLGFSEKDPKLNVGNPASISTNILGTPSRQANTIGQTKSPYTFTFKREHSLELSPAAKSLMHEKRAEIARIKNQMKSQEGEAELGGNALGRKIATPRAQKSRFSDAHNAAFDKMDSIAGHASAYRKHPSHVGTPAKGKAMDHTPSKPSAIDSTTSAKKVASVASKQASSVHKFEAGSVPAQHSKRMQFETNDESPSPRKRVKLSGTATPQRSDSSNEKTETVLDRLTTPTKSTLVRAASTKAVKPSAIPAPARTPSKLTDSHTTIKPVAALSQSPLKAAIFGSPVQQKTAQSTDAYLARSPLRAAASQDTEVVTNKPFVNKLLAYSPSKLEKKSQELSQPVEERLLMQTPAKANSIVFGAEKPFASHSKIGNAKISDRFKLLRKSPVKSILRTPQRLYSTDPAKVAAGTHLATPQKMTGDIGRVVPATAPVRKHVEFSSSTKAREAVKTASMSPTPAVEITYPTIDKVDYPVLDFSNEMSTSPSKRRQSSIPRDFTFRAGADIVFAPTQAMTQQFSQRPVNSPSTIRRVFAEEPEIKVPATNSKKRKIEFEDAASVAKLEASPTVVLGSKKRKFDFENDVVEKRASTVAALDKENIATESEEEKRPAKRLKANPVIEKSKPIAAKKEPTLNKRPTLGVKPKHEMRKSPEKQNKKSGSTISRARLNALAMPKKRS